MKKILFSLLTVCALLTLLAVGVHAEVLRVEGTPLLYDGAGLLSESEASQVLSKLQNVSDKYGIDVAVVTVSSMSEYGYYGSSASMNFADDYFDYNGFGRGSERSGLVLLLAMEERDWWISTRGSAIRTFTDYGINDYIGERGDVISNFSDGNYAAGFSNYADRAEELLRYEQQNGMPYDYDSDREPVKAFSPLRVLGSALTGLLGGLIPVSSMKSQLKSVRGQGGARSYARQDSVAITSANDWFIGRHVSRTPRETERSSGGGSSIHVSSSGASHGGGGGKF